MVNEPKYFIVSCPECGTEVKLHIVTTWPEIIHCLNCFVEFHHSDSAPREIGKKEFFAIPDYNDIERSQISAE